VQFRRLWRRELVVPAVAVFVLALPVFSRLISGADPTSTISDHSAHLNYTRKLIRNGEAPPHPLFHYMVALLALNDRDSLAHLQYVAAFVLALALAVRAYLTAMLLSAEKTATLRQVVGLCLALALVMPLPNWWSSPPKIAPLESAFFQLDMPAPIWWDLPSVRWGQLSPNIWHNPTGIFAMPFCLLVFLAGLAALERPSLTTMALAGAAMVLSLLAKPNYVLAFGPCFAIAAFAVWNRAIDAGRLSFGAVLGQALLALGPATLVLVRQFQSTFGEHPGEIAGVRIAALAGWSVLMKPQYIPYAILLSIAFPLTVAILYWRDVFRDRTTALAWAVFAVSVVQFLLLAETGKRAEHGNFGWGAVLANQVLFVACCDFLLRQPPSNSRNVAFIVFGFHLLSGCICLARCLFVPSMANAF
jgi:hypothetical protein